MAAIARPWSIVLAAVALPLVGLAPAAATHVEPSRISWACGPGGGGQSGHPDQCGIDPIGGTGVGAVGQPVFGDAWIDGASDVVGVAIGGDARAYPIVMLDRHEIVNDVIAGIPVAVTYCPLCGSGVTFERTVAIAGAPRQLDFSASGFLYRHDLVMWDPQTDTLWTQILGEPIATLDERRVVETHASTVLRTISTQITTWEGWREAHPSARMLQPLPGARYGGAYAGYGDSCRIGISGTSDCDIEGLHPKEQVIGVVGPGGSIAFPLFAVAQGTGVAVDAATQTVVAVAAGGIVSAHATGGRTFQLDGSTWRDGTGATWDLAAGIRGDHGARLDPLEHAPMYWFAWVEHHPDTALWLPTEAEGAKPTEDDRRVPGLPVVAALAILAAAAVLRRRLG